jgi:hypothetical protein
MKLSELIEKLGAIGAFLAAAALPCCFPLFAIIGTSLGLSILNPWLKYMDWVIQLFSATAFIGSIFSYRSHKNIWPSIISVVSVTLIFYYFYGESFLYLVYLGLLGLAIAAIFNIILKRNMKKIPHVVLLSIITCPQCGFKKEETMPTDACQFFYKCSNCETLLKPKKGDCCVYCSYGTSKCPSIQSKEDCCVH